MSDFKQRLQDEKLQLEERIEKLDAFIGSENFGKIAGIQQSLLKSQLPVMQSYHRILSERIWWLEPQGDSQA